MDNKIKEVFDNHVKNNYDMSNENIARKYYHSYRVMNLCSLIAKSEKYDNNDIDTCIVLGLLHDIGRFEQWKLYNTYKDLESVDHAELGIDILFNNEKIKDFCNVVENYDEIYDSIKYHNKIKIPDNLSEHNKCLCRVLRDADKLDIMYLISINSIKLNECNMEFSEKIINDFMSCKSIDIHDVKNDNENILMKLAFVYDLNFKYSFKFIKKYKLIDKIYDNINDKERFLPYIEKIKEYIDNKLI